MFSAQAEGGGRSEAETCEIRPAAAPLLRARLAYLLALAAGWILMLAVDAPGHLTLDSVLELFEGRFRIRQSWAPSFYAWVLGVFDAVWRGTGLYLAASGLVLFGALASFSFLRGRTSWWAPVTAALLAASPLVLIYQGVVWKDVLFANVSVAGMACLAWAVLRRPRGRARALWLGASLAWLAAAALLRQNGVVVGVFAAAALGWIEGRDGGLRRGLAWGLGALAAVVLASHAMNLATQPDGPGSGDGMAEGVRVLQTYDLLGALAAEPSIPLPAIDRAAPAASHALRALAPRYWSAERTDFTDAQPQIAAAVARLPDAAVTRDWLGLVLRRPGLYLRNRAAVFGWVFLTPRIERCVPVCLGVQGPAEVLAQLGMKPRWSAADGRLFDYDAAFLRTPVYFHLAYAVLALAVGLILLLRRGDPADIVVAALQASGLAFAASFFLISIACDYRYLYFLDLAAMTGLVYLAIDPPAGRPPRPGQLTPRGSTPAPSRSRR
jgi:hypothetical protein